MVKLATQIAGRFDSSPNEKGTTRMAVLPWLAAVENVVKLHCNVSRVEDVNFTVVRSMFPLLLDT